MRADKMSHVWLLVHNKNEDFDILVEDTDKCHLMGLFEKMFEESAKQNAYLPLYFTLYINKPRTNRKMELADDSDMLKMWEWNKGKDTIEVWVEETKEEGFVCKSAEANWEKKLREEAIRRRLLQEELKRKAEMEEAERQIREQQQFIVSVEVPVVNAEDHQVEYVRIFNTDGMDECFPGCSQPEPSQTDTQSYPPPQQQNKPPSPVKHKPTRKKLTPKKKKPTPKTNPTQQAPLQPSSPPRQPTPPPSPPPHQSTTPPHPPPSPPPHQSTTPPHPPPSPPPHQSTTPPHPPPSPPPHQSTTPPHQASPPPTQTTPPPQPTQPTPPPQPTQPTPPPSPTQPSPPRQPTSSLPKTTTRNKPKGWRVPKSTALKQGTHTKKGQGGGNKGGKRVRRQIDVMEAYGDDDLSTDDDSDDSDYVQSNATEDDESDDSDGVVSDLIDEDELVDYDSDVQEKRFEDYLDGSHKLDKMYTNGKIWSHSPFGSISLEEWMIFESKTQFLQVFRDFCIQEGFAVTVEKADNQRYTAACVVESCNWRIHATVLKDNVSWAIKTLTGKHSTCGRLEENPMVSSEWLCRHLLQDLQANPETPVDSLQKLCMERFRIHVKLRLFYKVKSIAREQIYGGFAESYGLLPSYAEMIKASNPGSYALITWTGDSANQDHQFKACFFSFAASVKGFLGGCRPIIGIDGAHLSGYYKGIMLTAVAIDGNNEIFVIAFGIVDTESIDSWSYFFRNLRCLFANEGCQKDYWTFISDRMRSVEAALYDVFPRATRRVCCQHLYSNCKNAGWSGSAFHKLFWIAANAYNDFAYEKAMSKIKEHDEAAEQYLRNVDEQWSRHKFDTKVCCDHNTTNFVESFNACTKPNRDMPVLTLLEAVRTWIMKRVGSRFDKAVDMDPNDLTEYAHNILKIRGDESRLCHATACGGGEFEVRNGHVKFPVTLSSMICGCGKWQGSGIPCKHGLRVIYNQRLDPANFVSPYFKGAAYKATYANHIHPMADPTHWQSFNVPHISPPTVKRSAGRPTKQRRRGPNEARKGKRHNNNKCSICKELGHNIKTCKNKSQAKTRSSAGQAEGRGKKRNASEPSTSHQAPHKRRKTSSSKKVA
ncbi:Filamentous hemagglutinin [Bienertia sinuspersici]